MSCFLRVQDFANVLSGVAVERHGKRARAVMVGDLKGGGRLATGLKVVGPPKAGLEARLQPNDIVISLRGNTNFCAIVPGAEAGSEPLFATLDVAVIRLNDGAPIEADFLVCYLNLPETQKELSGHRSGTAALRLPLGPLKDLRVPIPSPDRQAAIAALNWCAVEERALAERLAVLRTELIDELLYQAAAAPAVTRN